MSVLLRQAHGFEGVLASRVIALARDLPAADREHPCRASLQFDPVAPTDMAREGHHHLLTGCDVIVYFVANGFPDSVYISKETLHLLALVDATLRTVRPRLVILVVGGLALAGGRPIAAAYRVERSPSRSPRSPATSPAQYPAVSGLGVSVLLRQARSVVRGRFVPAHPQRCSGL